MASFIRDIYKVLTPEERRTLRGIEQAIKKAPTPKEASGRLFLAARNLLQPYGTFMRWLELMGVNYRTVVRRIDAYSGRINEIINSPEVILKECFRSIENRLPRLPESEREKFCENLVGLMMTRVGMTHPKQFQPKEIPADFPVSASGERSQETRRKIAASAKARWERVRAASEE